MTNMEVSTIGIKCAGLIGAVSPRLLEGDLVYGQIVIVRSQHRKITVQRFSLEGR